MKMRTCVLAMVLFFVGFQATAQRARYKPQAHELSIQVGNVDAVFPFIADGAYRSSLPFATQVANGIRYTYHTSLKDGIRLSFFNRRSLLENDVVMAEATRVERQLQIGYERKYHNGPHQVSFGPEILVNAGNTEYPTGGETFGFQSLGAAFALGYSYFFSPFVSAGIEGNVYYINPSYSRVLDNPQAFPGFVNQENIAGITAGIWLNFHFVKMKKRCKCPGRK